MRITIQAPNLGLTPALTDFILKKIGELDRFLKQVDPESVFARVDVGRSTRHHRHGRVYHVDVNLRIPGGTLRAAYDDEDIRKAINVVKERLEREIKKFKGRHK